MKAEKVVEEIFTDAKRRVSRARVGKPGHPLPAITDEQKTVLVDAWARLVNAQERTLWKMWNRRENKQG